MTSRKYDSVTILYFSRAFEVKNSFFSKVLNLDIQPLCSIQSICRLSDEAYLHVRSTKPYAYSVLDMVGGTAIQRHGIMASIKDVHKKPFFPTPSPSL